MWAYLTSCTPERSGSRRLKWQHIRRLFQHAPPPQKKWPFDSPHTWTCLNPLHRPRLWSAGHNSDQRWQANSIKCGFKHDLKVTSWSRWVIWDSFIFSALLMSVVFLFLEIIIFTKCASDVKTSGISHFCGQPQFNIWVLQVKLSKSEKKKLVLFLLLSFSPYKQHSSAPPWF